MVISDVRCPSCQRSVDSYFGLTTGLGPPTARCAGCAALVDVGRSEWSGFSTDQKVRYVILSLIGAGVCGVLGGVGVRAGVHFTEAGPFEDRMTLEGPGFRAGIIVWAIAVVALQCVRVSLSIRRAAHSPADPPRSSGWLNFALDLQMKLLALIFLVPLVAWAVSYLRSR